MRNLFRRLLHNARVALGHSYIGHAFSQFEEVVKHAERGIQNLDRAIGHKYEAIGVHYAVVDARKKIIADEYKAIGEIRDEQARARQLIERVEHFLHG